MKEKKYQNQIMYTRILIILLVLILILIMISFILQKVKQNNTPDKEPMGDSFTTVKEVIEYYRCKYIAEQESTSQEYAIDISLVFTTPLYEEDKNNEKFYQDIIEDVAKVLRYQDFRMLDTQNDITIEVICDNGKIMKILINGIEDYFIYMDSQIDLKNYVELPITPLDIEASPLAQLIENHWQNTISFGSRDSIFEGYDIYFDEGIQVRNVQNIIHNIVFTEKYEGSVVNGIEPGTDLKTIQAKLGNPTFKNTENHVIGYKSEKCYVFFTNDEIAVYQREEENVDDFLALVDQFLADELELLEFMNQLTYLWPDYEEYTYTTNSVYLTYPLKGVEIKINYDNMNGIIVYNNFHQELSKIEKYLENTEFIARLKIDGVFASEKRRVEKKGHLLEKCKEYTQQTDEEQEQQDTLSMQTNKQTENTMKESAVYGIYADKDENGKVVKMNFIAKNKEHPNRELYDNMDTYLWMTDTYFLFSKKNKGIYFYNLETGYVQNLISGKENYELKELKDGILHYDDMEVTINY